MAKEKRKQKKTRANDSLTPRQEAFCRYYVDTGYAVEAYRMAYNTENQKYDTIRVNANKLFRNTAIILRIEEIQREESERSRVDRAKVEQVLLNIINADPSDLYHFDEKSGKFRIKSPTQIPKRLRNAMKSIKNNKGVVSYEFNGKTEAARLLGSWNGWDAPTQIDVRSKDRELTIGFDDEDE